MSYLVLARKWRPQTFEEVVGQKPIVRTLQNAVARNRVSHAMIFSGVRGVGKTTLARIMAKALNCHSGPTRTPCCQCEACNEIKNGTAIDLHEIDGASNRGIQEIRELKENIRFFPTTNRYKIIIIDEVHMLTTEAFNALLKTLEEPPEHVYFMFATTELHKIPITILSRCQRYELTRVTSPELAEFFEKIAKAEKVTISSWALAQIVREAEGSVRDGLSLLDQVFSFADSSAETNEIEITDEDVVEVLGLIDRQVINDLAVSLLSGDLPKSLQLLDAAYGHGIDLKRFTVELLQFFRALLVCKVTSQPEDLLHVGDQDLTDLKEIAAGQSTETVHNFLQLLLRGVEEMQYSKHPRLALETTFIKTTQTGKIVPVSQLLGKMDELLQGFDRDEPTMKTDTQVQAVQKDAVSAAGQEQEIKKKLDEKVTQDRKVIIDKTEFAVPVIPAKDSDIRKQWDAFIDYVMDRKKWMAHSLRLSSGVREEEGQLIIKFAETSDCKMLQTSEHMKILTVFAQDFFQRELQATIIVKGKVSTDPESGNSNGPQEERRALARDPLVQMTTDIFDGQIENIRTGPRSR